MTASRYRDPMNTTISLAFLSADDRMTWFCDDDRCTDRDETFDAYAFNAWQEVQYDEDHREPETCDCHRYKRYCGICRPY
jgi:hypothetical protein